MIAGWACSLLVGVVCGEAKPDAPPESATTPITFVVPGESTPRRIRLALTHAGRSPETAWREWSARFFGFYDADQNGALNRAEAGRLPPSPTLWKSASTPIRVVELDVDHDGGVTLIEWQTYCRKQQFLPVIGLSREPDAADRRLGELLFPALDADGSGGVSGAELSAAGRRLQRFDLNDDEFLSRTELLGETAAPRRSDWQQADPSETADGELMAIELTDERSAAAVCVIHDRVLVRIAPHRRHSPIQSAAEFLLAQFDEVAGSQKIVDRAVLERDPLLGGLLAPFSHADRNGDNRLQCDELRAYLDLIADGVNAWIGCYAVDHGRNLFGLFDADGDGRISPREAASAAAVVLADERVEIRRLFTIEFGPPPIATWGGIAVPAIKPTPPAKPTASTLPAWFQAQDRNDDGVLSAREFLGPSHLFSQLDADKNGIVLPDELPTNQSPSSRR